jgi:hypothetical protein
VPGQRNIKLGEAGQSIPEKGSQEDGQWTLNGWDMDIEGWVDWVIKGGSIGEWPKVKTGGRTGTGNPKKGLFLSKPEGDNMKEGPHKDHRQRRDETKCVPNPWQEPAYIPSDHE